MESSVSLAGSGDFVITGQHTFEIGGKKKGFRQICGQEDTFIVADDIEVGFKNKLPLWLFGILY
jgi:hypothetical protein